MKILQIAPQIPVPPNNGARLSIYGITKYLALRGHEINFACYNKKKTTNEQIQMLSSSSRPFVYETQTDNNAIDAAVNIFSNVPYNISKFEKKEFASKIKELIVQNKFDVIHIDHLHMAWLVDNMREITDAPVVLREHNLEMEIMKRFHEYTKNPLLKKYAEIQYKKFLKYEPHFCEKFDTCVMISAHDELKLKSLNQNVRTKVIPAGVMPELLRLEKSRVEEESIAFLGSLEWFPNLDGISWFIESVMPMLKEVRPNIKLYLYGGGVPNNFFIPSFLRENIIVKGFVDDIWNEILKTELVIVPLRVGSGIRVKILELLAAGQNIVASSIAAEGIPVENEKHILIADSAMEFTDKIDRFLNHRFDNAAMIRNGKELIASNFTWERIAEQFEQLYMSLQ